MLFKFPFPENGKYRLDNYLSICLQIHQIRLCVFSVKTLAGKRENGLRGSSIAGLQGKAERDNSQARTKRSNNIPFQWKGHFRRATNLFW